MKSKWPVISAAVTLVLLVFSITPTLAQGPNRVFATVSRQHVYFVDADRIDNTPVDWTDWLYLDMHNYPDGGGPVAHPKIQLQTALPFVSFWPNDHSVFTAQPDLGTYTWDFPNVQIAEPAHLGITGGQGHSTATPRFSASRVIEPEILTGNITTQTVTFSFTLEEPLPLEVNRLGILIGTPVFAYGHYQLVDGQFVSQVPVDGWQAGTDGITANWTTNSSSIVLGKTYVFQAVLRSVKSTELLGSPVYKPGVTLSYFRANNPPAVTTGTSVNVSTMDNVVSATFSADNVVDWQPSILEPRWDFRLNNVVSQVTPPPPPFHVLVPATVRIESETVNLGSNGVLTAFVQLPKQYSAKDVDLATVTLHGAQAVHGVVDGDSLILKFKREGLQNLTPGDMVALQITGKLVDGSVFEGMDTVRVLP